MLFGINVLPQSKYVSSSVVQLERRNELNLCQVFFRQVKLKKKDLTKVKSGISPTGKTKWPLSLALALVQIARAW